MNYEIRDMHPEDAPKVLEIYQQGIDGKNATFENTVPTWENWDADHFKNCRFVLITEDQDLVGWCALKPVSKRECYKGVGEVSIYLENQFQGKGLGSILLEKLILDSGNEGFWTLQSGIFPENEASISIHQKFGFRLVGKREKIAKMDGIWRDVILMERRNKNII